MSAFARVDRYDASLALIEKMPKKGAALEMLGVLGMIHAKLGKDRQTSFREKFGVFFDKHDEKISRNKNKYKELLFGSDMAPE